MNIVKLKTRREKLIQQVKQIDSQLAKAERAQREAEQRELVKLIQSRGITTARLAAILDAAPGVVGTTGEER